MAEYVRHVSTDKKEMATMSPEVAVAGPASIPANQDGLDPLREQVAVQGQDGNWNYDDYMRGMYNGLECALATLEKREPEYR